MSMMHRTAPPTEKYLAQNFDQAEVERACHALITGLGRSLVVNEYLPTLCKSLPSWLNVKRQEHELVMLISCSVLIFILKGKSKGGQNYYYVKGIYSGNMFIYWKIKCSFSQ